MMLAPLLTIPLILQSYQITRDLPKPCTKAEFKRGVAACILLERHAPPENFPLWKVESMCDRAVQCDAWAGRAEE